MGPLEPQNTTEAHRTPETSTHTTNLDEVECTLSAHDTGVAVLFRHCPKDGLRGYPLLRIHAGLHHVVQKPRVGSDTLALQPNPKIPTGTNTTPQSMQSQHKRHVGVTLVKAEDIHVVILGRGAREGGGGVDLVSGYACRRTVRSMIDLLWILAFSARLLSFGRQTSIHRYHWLLDIGRMLTMAHNILSCHTIRVHRVNIEHTSILSVIAIASLHWPALSKHVTREV